MTSHFGVMLLFAAGVALVFAALGRDEDRARRIFAARIFGGLVVGAYVVGWLMLALIR